MKAFVITPGATAHLSLADRPVPTPASNEALIRVTAFSLNRGEIRYAANKPAGTPIGWDVVGIVVKTAATGGPAVGTRVVGWSKRGEAFAEYCALPVDYLAPIPGGVSDDVAACLPVAGLTALYVLERGSRFVGNRVLITGASGGVGHIAVQLARAMGATVVAQVRRDEQVAELKSIGAHEVIVDAAGPLCAAAGPFQFIADGVGGGLTTEIIKGLAPRGTLVVYGATEGSELTVSVGQLLRTNFQQIQGFTLYQEDSVAPIADGLRRLLALCVDGRIHIDISLTADWSQVPTVAQSLMDRGFAGKAVLRVG